MSPHSTLETFDIVIFAPTWSSELEGVMDSHSAKKILVIVPEKLTERKTAEGGSIHFRYLSVSGATRSDLIALRSIRAECGILMLSKWREMEFVRYISAFALIRAKRRERHYDKTVTTIKVLTIWLTTLFLRKVALQRTRCCWIVMQACTPVWIPLVALLRLACICLTRSNLKLWVIDSRHLWTIVRNWQWLPTQSRTILRQRFPILGSLIGAYFRNDGAPADSNSSVKNILIIQPDLLGDTISTIPLMRELRRQFPDSQIDCVVSPKGADLLRGCPFIDHFITLREFHPGNHSSRPFPGHKDSTREITKKLREKPYELAINASYWPERSILINGIRAKRKISVRSKFHLLWNTEEIDHPSPNVYDKITELCPRNNVIAERASKADLWVSDEEKSLFRLQLDHKEGTRLIGISTFAALSSRRLPIETFLECMKWIATNYAVRFIVFDSKSWIWRRSGFENGCTFVGDIGLRDMMAAMSHLDLFIANEGGLGHIAYALNIPCCLVYTSIDPLVWSPGPLAKCLYNKVPCSPCGNAFCHKNLECHSSLTSSDLIRAAHSLLGPINPNTIIPVSP